MIFANVVAAAVSFTLGAGPKVPPSPPCKPAPGYSAAELVAMLPAVPANLCRATASAKEAYQARIGEVGRKVREEMERRSERTQAISEDANAAMASRMAAQAGLSAADMKALEEGSDEEADRVADKILQSQANLSMDELKRLDKMSPQAQQAALAAYAKEQQAVAAADPRATRAQGDRAKRMHELTLAQRELVEQAGADRARAADVMKKVRSDPELKAIAARIDELRPANAERIAGADTVVIGGKRVSTSAALSELATKEDLYCTKGSELYVKAARKAEAQLVEAEGARCSLDRTLDELQRVGTESKAGTVVYPDGTSWLTDFNQIASLRSNVYDFDVRPTWRIDP
jgi:hypothetical protein